MTNKEILEKAIQKAIAGGWDAIHTTRKRYVSLWNDGTFQVATTTDKGTAIGIQLSIYNHEFAKAIWGDETGMIEDPLSGYKLGYGPTWKEKLMAMVVSDDPIAYLGQHI